jgi:hypothetical protein
MEMVTDRIQTQMAALCLKMVVSGKSCTGTPSYAQVKETPNYVNSRIAWHLTLVPVVCCETSVTDCQSALSNITEKRRST